MEDEEEEVVARAIAFLLDAPMSYDMRRIALVGLIYESSKVDTPQSKVVQREILHELFENRTEMRDLKMLLMSDPPISDVNVGNINLYKTDATQDEMVNAMSIIMDAYSSRDALLVNLAKLIQQEDDATDEWRETRMNELKEVTRGEVFGAGLIPEDLKWTPITASAKEIQTLSKHMELVKTRARLFNDRVVGSLDRHATAIYDNFNRNITSERKQAEYLLKQLFAAQLVSPKLACMVLLNIANGGDAWTEFQDKNILCAVLAVVLHLIYAEHAFPGEPITPERPELPAWYNEVLKDLFAKHAEHIPAILSQTRRPFFNKYAKSIMMDAMLLGGPIAPDSKMMFAPSTWNPVFTVMYPSEEASDVLGYSKALGVHVTGSHRALSDPDKFIKMCLAIGEFMNGEGISHVLRAAPFPLIEDSESFESGQKYYLRDPDHLTPDGSRSLWLPWNPEMFPDTNEDGLDLFRIAQMTEAQPLMSQDNDEFVPNIRGYIEFKWDFGERNAQFINKVASFKVHPEEEEGVMAEEDEMMEDSQADIVTVTEKVEESDDEEERDNYADEVIAEFKVPNTGPLVEEAPFPEPEPPMEREEIDARFVDLVMQAPITQVPDTQEEMEVEVILPTPANETTGGKVVGEPGTQQANAFALDEEEDEMEMRDITTGTGRRLIVEEEEEEDVMPGQATTTTKMKVEFDEEEDDVGAPTVPRVQQEIRERLIFSEDGGQLLVLGEEDELDPIPEIDAAQLAEKITNTPVLFALGVDFDKTLFDVERRYVAPATGGYKRSLNDSRYVDDLDAMSEKLRQERDLMDITEELGKSWDHPPDFVWVEHGSKIRDFTPKEKRFLDKITKAICKRRIGPDDEQTEGWARVTRWNPMSVFMQLWHEKVAEERRVARMTPEQRAAEKKETEDYEAWVSAGKKGRTKVPAPRYSTEEIEVIANKYVQFHRVQWDARTRKVWEEGTAADNPEPLTADDMESNALPESTEPNQDDDAYDRYGALFAEGIFSYEEVALFDALYDQFAPLFRTNEYPYRINAVSFMSYLVRIPNGGADLAERFAMSPFDAITGDELLVGYRLLDVMTSNKPYLAFPGEYVPFERNKQVNSFARQRREKALKYAENELLQLHLRDIPVDFEGEVDDPEDNTDLLRYVNPPKNLMFCKTTVATWRYKSTGPMRVIREKTAASAAKTFVSMKQGGNAVRGEEEDDDEDSDEDDDEAYERRDRAERRERINYYQRRIEFTESQNAIFEKWIERVGKGEEQDTSERKFAFWTAMVAYGSKKRDASTDEAVVADMERVLVKVKAYLLFETPLKPAEKVYYDEMMKAAAMEFKAQGKELKGDIVKALYVRAEQLGSKRNIEFGKVVDSNTVEEKEEQLRKELELRSSAYRYLVRMRDELNGGPPDWTADEEGDDKDLRDVEITARPLYATERQFPDTEDGRYQAYIWDLAAKIEKRRSVRDEDGGKVKATNGLGYKQSFTDTKDDWVVRNRDPTRMRRFGIKLPELSLT